MDKVFCHMKRVIVILHSFSPADTHLCMAASKPFNDNECDVCGSNHFFPTRGYYVCRNCGTVGEQVYVDSSYDISGNSIRQPSQYSSIGKKLTRTGNLGSEIGYFRANRFTTIHGKTLSPQKMWKFKRLRDHYHNRSKNASSQTHLRTFIIFNRISSKLEVPNSVKERASYLYWKLCNDHEDKITNHVLLIALCLLYAVKETGSKSPLKFQEIVHSFNAAGHRVTNKNILRLAKELEIPLNKTPIRKSEDYVERIASIIVSHSEIKHTVPERYGLSLKIYKALLINTSTEFLSFLSKKERGGMQPYALAVSVAYIADRAISRFLKKIPVLTQRKVADLTNGKEFTVRDHCYKLLSKAFEEHKTALFDKISLTLTTWKKN